MNESIEAQIIALEGMKAAALPEHTRGPSTPERDPRLPQSGIVLSRTYKGRQILMTVLDSGFAFEGREYKSLSAIAGEVTGTRWNGFQFFGLQAKEGA